MAKCERLGLPFAPITRPAELFDDPHLNASGGLVPVTLPNGAASKLPALPLSFDGARPGAAQRPAHAGPAQCRDHGRAGRTAGVTSAGRGRLWGWAWIAYLVVTLGMGVVGI